jgi:hypothetical protein
MFEGEALGLKAMYDTKSIRVPLPYKVSEDSDARTCITCVMHKTVQYITTQYMTETALMCAHHAILFYKFEMWCTLQHSNCFSSTHIKVVTLSKEPSAY